MTTTHPNPTSDADLLRRYASNRSPDAFAAIVDRYLPLIYSAAMRQTHDRHLAEDVSQAALIIFSQKASHVDPSILPGWLLKTTHYAARNALRQRTRRTIHEQRAAAMKSESDIPADPDALSRVLDPALARLGDTDRTAVVLRYFQNKSFADIAAQLQTTESAVQRRIARAVEKLRAILARQGVTIAPAALPGVLAAQALHPVPSSLAIHAASLAGSKAAASTSLIAKGALHAMAAAKVKATVAIAAAVLLVGASVPAVYHYVAATPSSQPVAAAPSYQPLPVGTDMSRPATGSLPPGMSAEPLAIMNLADKRWIRPTGGEFPFDSLPAKVKDTFVHFRMEIPGATHVLLFRITSPDRSVEWKYSVPQTGAMGSTGSYDETMRALYHVIFYRPTPGSTSTVLTISAATDKWTNCAVIPVGGAAPVTGNVDGVTYTFDPPAEDVQGTYLKRTASLNSLWKEIDLCANCYAVTADGKKVSCNSTSRNGRSVRYNIPGRLSDYKEIRFETRPYSHTATYTPVPLP